MSSTESPSYVNLAQKARKIGPIQETLLGVLGIVGIGNTRVNIDGILNQVPSEVVKAGLENNEKVQGVLAQVGTTAGASNDESYLKKAA